MSNAYKEAGVDVTAGYEAVSLMKKLTVFAHKTEADDEYLAFTYPFHFLQSSRPGSSSFQRNLGNFF